MGIGDGNRRAWEIASQKYVEESERFLRMADAGTLLPLEARLLAPLLSDHPTVLHLQSGNGTDDVELARLGARVIGADFSAKAVASSIERAVALRVDCTYVVADALRVPLQARSVDLVYTGKGALMWLPDLRAWAAELARVLRPGGHVFVYDAHPAAPLWTGDERTAGLRDDRSYFRSTRVNDTFPASAISRFGEEGEAAVERQWTLADTVNALLGAGLQLLHLGEHSEPFWRPDDGAAIAAWGGSLPNSFSLVAARPG